ncbi:helix-turn-helix domain-containing protein [Burkholderia pseudomallei]
MPAKPLTQEQKEDAARLRTLFKEWQHVRKEHGQPSSQMEAAAQLEFGQSALSQYLRGEIPLNVPVVAKFVRLLDCKVEDISPALAEKASELAKAFDFTFQDPSTGEYVIAEVKRRPITTNSGNTEEDVNPSIPSPTSRVNNERLKIAQRFTEELLTAVVEGRVTDELLDTLTTVFRLGTAAVESAPRGDQHHTKMVKARGSRKRGTGT